MGARSPWGAYPPEGVCPMIAQAGGKKPIRARCPTCGRAVEYSPENAEASDAFPFCSERCRLADLDKWFEEEYRIERRATEADLEQED